MGSADPVGRHAARRAPAPSPAREVPLAAMDPRFGSALVFLAVLVAGGALLLSDAAQDGLRQLSIAITTLSAGMLSALGVAVEPRGQELIAIGRPFGVSVENDCNGAWAHLVLLASVLAYPATTREKIRGLLIAQPALFA